MLTLLCYIDGKCRIIPIFRNVHIFANLTDFSNNGLYVNALNTYAAESHTQSA